MLLFCYRFVADSIVVREYILYDVNSFKFVEFFLWPRIYSVLIYVPRALENNVYSAGAGGVLVGAV